MKPYNELTRPGKLKRLHALAQQALTHYKILGPRLTYHCFETNLLYRVDAADGSRYVLRLASPGWRTRTDLESEAMWLDALSIETDLCVPQIVRSAEGAAVLQMSEESIPDTWNTTLMSWLPGRLLGKYINTQNLEKMGALFARMHIHGKEWQPPLGFSQRVFEHFVSRGEDEILMEDDQTRDYTPAQSAQLGRMVDLVSQTYAQLDRDDLRVIHCDLWHDNIKIHRGILCPFDFEDTIWGFRLHDIAMAMLDLLEDFGNDRYPDLLASFRRGYETLLVWPEGDMTALQIGRLLWKINYVARFEREWLPQMVERHEKIFDNYEKTGQVLVFAQ
jgi:Ser/Thr protein kinase RdoA (MazF antagonist)